MAGLGQSHAKVQEWRRALWLAKSYRFEPRLGQELIWSDVSRSCSNHEYKCSIHKESKIWASLDITKNKLQKLCYQDLTHGSVCKLLSIDPKKTGRNAASFDLRLWPLPFGDGLWSTCSFRRQVIQLVRGGFKMQAPCESSNNPLGSSSCTA